VLCSTLARSPSRSSPSKQLRQVRPSVGYRKASPVNSEAGARKYEELLTRRLLRGEPPFGTKRDLSPRLVEFVSNWLQTYAKTRYKPSYYTTAERILDRHLLPHLGQTRLDGFTRSLIDDYVHRASEVGLGNKTINNHLAVLASCLRTAVDWQYIKRAPKIRWLKAATPRLDFLSRTEVDTLLGAGTNVYRNMALLAVNTGMRIGEIRALSWDSVDLERRLVYVRRSVVRRVMSSPKNYRSRFVPMTTAVHEMLSASSGQPENAFVFVGQRGGAVPESTAGKGLRRLCLLAGIRPIGWHVLRHTFATQLVAEDVNIRVIQTLLGHSSLVVTERYAHVAPTTSRKAIDRLKFVPDSVGSQQADKNTSVK
jgi:integrase